MEIAEISELISAFVPEEILRDFELKEVKKECGVYRLYMDVKDDKSHYPPALAEAKEVVRCGYMNPCEIQTLLIACREAFIYIRRRTWKEKGGRESYFNTYKYTIEGIKCTPKFGAFLKEICWRGRPFPMRTRWRTSFTSSVKSSSSSRACASATDKRSLLSSGRRIRR